MVLRQSLSFINACGAGGKVGAHLHGPVFIGPISPRDSGSPWRESASEVCLSHNEPWL